MLPRHSGHSLPSVHGAQELPVQRAGRPGAGSGLTCDGCGRPAHYAFEAGRSRRCLRHALFAPSVRARAAKVALVVGAILFAINQLDVVVRGELTSVVIAKIALTFLVPYSVSTYSSLGASRIRV